MKGFIRQRGDAWGLRVYLGADPVTGKQRYAGRTVRAGKREDQRVLNEMIIEAERGLAARRNETAGELLEAWFGARRTTCAERTYRAFVAGHRGYVAIWYAVVRS